jgi:hypothetical protein
MSLSFPAYDQCPKEMALIGKMLAAYGDMEFDLTSAVGVVHSTDMAVKALFRPRGESARVEVADAMARAAYEKFGLGTDWGSTVTKFKLCLKIRNQYAHCQWFWRSDIGLGFVAMEDLAKERRSLSLTNLTVYPLDLTLLKTQEKYFAHVQAWLRYLTNRYAKKTGQALIFDYPRPTKATQPILHKPQIQPSRQSPDTHDATHN